MASLHDRTMAAKENVDPDGDLIDFQPPRKKPKKPDGARFKAPMTDDEMAVISKGYVPQSTQKNTAWVLRVFLEWKAERNKTASGEKCPEDLLDSFNAQKLNHWLAICYVSEKTGRIAVSS